MTQISHRSDIANITNALPCEVTTDENHGFATDDFVRLTNIVGMAPINNYRFKIIVTGLTTFSLRYPITDLPVDSTLYPPYVMAGSCNRVEDDFYYYPNGPDYAEENEGTGDDIIVNTP